MKNNLIHIASIVITMLSISILSCQESDQESIVKPITILQPAFRINADDHPELTLSDFMGLQAVGDFEKNNQRIVVLCNMRNNKIIYFNRDKNSVIRQFVLPDVKGRWPISNLRVLGEDSILYFSTNAQRLNLFSVNKIIANYELSPPIVNEPNSVYSGMYVQGASINKWHGLMTYANYEDAGGSKSDSIMDVRNLYSFFNISSGKLIEKTYPVKSFFKIHERNPTPYNCCPYFVYNDSFERIDYYYNITDTIKSYYLNTGKLETRTIAGTKHPIELIYLPNKYTGEEFARATENSTTFNMYYDSINNKYIRRIKDDTTLVNNRQSRRVHVEILNDEFEVLHDRHVFTGQDPTALVQLSDGVYFARLDRKNKTWVYEKVVYPVE